MTAKGPTTEVALPVEVRLTTAQNIFWAALDGEHDVIWRDVALEVAEALGFSRLACRQHLGHE